MKTAHTLTSLALASLVLFSAGSASAAITVASPAWPVNLPAAGPAGYYLSGSVPTYNLGTLITLNSALLRSFAPINITPSVADEIAGFSVNMDTVGDVIPGAFGLATSSSGSASMITLGKVGNVTGTFSTEMLSLNLSGVSPLGPFMFRESPTRPSLGQTTISNVGGGLFQIDSFFDVFTELSVDGGQTWIPDSNGPMRMTLQGGPVPEPASALLAGLAGLALLRRRR